MTANLQSKTLIANWVEEVSCMYRRVPRDLWLYVCVHRYNTIIISMVCVCTCSGSVRVWRKVTGG